YAERTFEVLSDFRIESIAHQFVSGIHVRTADDDNVVCLSTFCYFHRPGRATLGVPRCEMRNENCVAEFDLIAVVENAIHFCRPAVTAAGRQIPRDYRGISQAPLPNWLIYRDPRWVDTCDSPPVMKVREVTRSN